MVACQWNYRTVSTSAHGVSAAMTAKRPQGGDAAQRVTYQVISDGASRA
jgi:hypothetical protein